uniref:Uncharacterized protein n=1 Tax=Physcomitrium patens TaxID=3218 RepID=A0A2K1IYI3_PHYPA|nr:hypothetical protein PHYPA_024156 [Physcomitrium patens]
MDGELGGKAMRVSRAQAWNPCGDSPKTHTEREKENEKEIGVAQDRHLNGLGSQKLKRS